MKVRFARGAVAGVAGTGVMTAFQKWIEMPLTGRPESFAPAKLLEKLLPVSPKDEQARRRLNYTTHFSLGVMWGTAYAIAHAAGLRGQRAIGTVFATVWTGDVIFNTALGLYKPWEWSARETVIDVVDKYVQAEATGVIFERLGREARA